MDIINDEQVHVVILNENDDKNEELLSSIKKKKGLHKYTIGNVFLILFH
jgi:hypothetical protein